jgi:hypothetical protein
MGNVNKKQCEIQTSAMKTNTCHTHQILAKFAKYHDKYLGELEFGEYSQTCVKRPTLDLKNVVIMQRVV